MPRRGGFTLLEIMFATVFVACTLFFMISILPTASLALRKGEDLESANLYGQQEIEAIKQALPNLPTPPPPLTTVITLNSTDFNIREQVTTVDTQGDFQLDEIVVRLARTDGKGKTVDLATRYMVRQNAP